MSWRQFLKSKPEALRVKRVQSPYESPHKTLKTLKNPEVEIEKIRIATLPEWQDFLCRQHGKFTGQAGDCNLEKCLCDAVIDCNGDLKQLRPYEIGHGITCGDVINRCRQDGDTGQELILNPVFFPLVASVIHENKKGRLL